MFVLSNFIMAIAVVLEYILSLYMWIVVIGAILSWFRPNPYNPSVRQIVFSIIRFIEMVTEPVYYQIRKRLPVVYGGLDLSPVVIFLIVIFLQTFIVRSLMGLARVIS